MPRWYAAFETYGDPAEKLKTIAECIRREDLSQIIPRLAIEKRAKKGKGGFYFAIAIESEERGQPPSVLEHLLTSQIFLSLVRGEGTRFAPLEREELRSMMGSEQTVEDIARVLRYARSGELSPDDPFVDPHEQIEPQDEDRLLDRTRRYDRLLVWISAMGSGSLTQLRGACVALGLSAPQDGTGRILRRLRLLGHLETSPDGKRWSVAPSALVQSGIDQDKMFLAGARDRALIETLRMYGEVEETPIGQGDAPSHVAVRLGDPRMVEVIDALRPLAAGRAGERIAAVLPNLDGWATTLQCVAAVMPERYDLRRYDGTAFVDVPLATDDGLYAFHEPSVPGLEPGDPKFTLYHDRLAGSWLRGDWYGLRYLAECRRRGSTGMPAYYDATAGQLAVLLDHRWPELFERTVVLASGQLPRVNGPWLVYDGVSRTLVDRLSGRLNLEIDGDLPDA